MVELNDVINVRDKGGGGEKKSQAVFSSLRLGLRGKTEAVDLKKSLDNICCARNGCIPDACPRQL